MVVFVNVCCDVFDNFYCYKMECIQIKIEGKGNGIKIVVVNLSSVVQFLVCFGFYFIKYFGFELGVQINIDFVDDCWIINGVYEVNKF